MTKRPEIRAATPADLESFYGRPIPWRVDAYVAVVDGRPIGVGGVYYEHGNEIAFSDFKPEMYRHRKTIVEGARRFRELFGDRRLVALANPQEPGAERFLSHLGFKSNGATPTGKGFFLEGRGCRASG